jgi:hypothetical protein
MPRTFESLRPLHAALLGVTHDDGARILEPRDLASGAALDAATTLADNWTDATADGPCDGDPAVIRSFLHDVDDTIALLTEWRNAVRAAITARSLPRA